MADELEMVPERDFWSRAVPHTLVPKPIAGYFFKVRDRLGMDMANLVLFAYREWGAEVAAALARRMLEFDSFEALLRFLEEKASKLGEGRELVSSLLFSYWYTHYFGKVQEERGKACGPARDLAMEVFHRLASIGVFYTPPCIVQIAEVEAGCRERVSKRCRRAYDTYAKLKEKEAGGSTARP